MKDKQVRARYTPEFKLEAVRQVRAGQDHWGGCQGYWAFRRPAWELGASRDQGRVAWRRRGRKEAKVSPEQMEIAGCEAEVARLRMERDIAKSSGVLRSGHAAGTPGYDKMRAVSGQSGVRGAGGQRQRVFQLAAGAARRAVAAQLDATATRPCWHIRAIHAEVKGEYGWPRMHKELLARASGGQGSGPQVDAAARHRPRPNASSW